MNQEELMQAVRQWCIEIGTIELLNGLPVPQPTEQTLTIYDID